MMTPQAAKPIAATLFANSICLMCWVQSETLSRRPNNSLIYFHNKNGKSWLPWHRPGDKRSELQLLYCLKAKKLSAIALTRSARWNQISAFKRDQLYRRSPKIQLAAWRRGGVSPCRRVAVSPCRRVGVSAFVTPKGYKNRPHRYAKRCGRDLAQGGGFAEPWVRCF
jgi:hypothetical protein